MLSTDNVMIVDGVAVLKNVTNGNEIKLVHDYAVNNNIEKFVAIATDGRKYGFDGKQHRILGPGEEFDINKHYVAPEVKIDLEPVLEVQAEAIALEVAQEEQLNIDEVVDHEKLKLQEDYNVLLGEYEKLCDQLSNFKKEEITLTEVIQFVKVNGYELIIK